MLLLLSKMLGTIPTDSLFFSMIETSSPGNRLFGVFKNDDRIYPSISILLMSRLLFADASCWLFFI